MQVSAENVSQLRFVGRGFSSDINMPLAPTHNPITTSSHIDCDAGLSHRFRQNLSNGGGHTFDFGARRRLGDAKQRAFGQVRVETAEG